jgi:hypothetical protein
LCDDVRGAFLIYMEILRDVSEGIEAPGRAGGWPISYIFAYDIEHIIENIFE